MNLVLGEKLQNLTFSKSSLKWKRELQLDQWSQLHSLIITISWDTVFQNRTKNEKVQKFENISWSETTHHMKEEDAT